MRRSTTACAGLLALAACAGGSETGNPALPTEIGLSVRTSDPNAVDVRSTGAQGTVIDKAWIALGQVAFLNPAQCAMVGDLDVEGATLIAANLVEPGVHLGIDVAPDAYCGMVVPLEMQTAQLPDGAPAELADHSVVISGERADGTPFMLMHAEQDELELLAEAGEIHVARDGAAMLLAFDVAKWMEGVDLDGAVADDDGIIHIDPSNHVALLTAFELNLECSLELYEDTDGDGEVTAGEDVLLARCGVE